MHREDKIKFLIEDDVDYILQTADGKHYLRSVLYNGHFGYNRLTEEELEEEYQSRLGNTQ